MITINCLILIASPYRWDLYRKGNSFTPFIQSTTLSCRKANRHLISKSWCSFCHGFESTFYLSHIHVYCILLDPCPKNSDYYHYYFDYRRLWPNIQDPINAVQKKTHKKQTNKNNNIKKRWSRLICLPYLTQKLSFAWQRSLVLPHHCYPE